MPKQPFLLVLFLFAGFLAACGSSLAATATAVPSSIRTDNTISLLDSITPEPTALELTVETAVSEPESLPTIILPISIYIIDDAAGVYSSQRTAEELTAVYQRVNEIWAQANIVFEIQTIARLEVPADPLQAILMGDFQPFFNSLGREIDILEPSLFNGFYSQRIGNANGVVPFGSRAFFVRDIPSVLDERVTSHEIGHILGLHHEPADPDRLMFSGTNGMTLTPEEITVVRYFATGILNRLR